MTNEIQAALDELDITSNKLPPITSCNRTHQADHPGNE